MEAFSGVHRPAKRGTAYVLSSGKSISERSLDKYAQVRKFWQKPERKRASSTREETYSARAGLNRLPGLAPTPVVLAIELSRRIVPTIEHPLMAYAALSPNHPSR
jgi:hypothetical protein